MVNELHFLGVKTGYRIARVNDLDMVDLNKKKILDIFSSGSACTILFQLNPPKLNMEWTRDDDIDMIQLFLRCKINTFNESGV